MKTKINKKTAIVFNEKIGQVDTIKKVIIECQKKIEDLKHEMYSQETRDKYTYQEKDDMFTQKEALVRKVRDLESELETIEIISQDEQYMEEYCYSDRHPYEIVEWRTPNKAIIRQMKATETEESKKKRMESFEPGGFFGHTDNSVQDWTLESNPNNPLIAVYKHKDGWFHDKGANKFGLIKKPYYFYDFNF